MAERDFDEWLHSFRDNIYSYDYYVDFKKVYHNVDGIKVELNILNSLIGSANIVADFQRLAVQYPSVLRCVPILLAVRATEISAVDAGTKVVYDFTSGDLDAVKCVILMQKTGLFDLLSHHIVNNLVDYVTGVEVGLDSNGRKNRSGHLMENLVESYIIKAGFKRDETYFKEMYLGQVEDRWNLNLASLSNDGKAEKRFDFIIKTPRMVYGIETNFYSGGGSKLNETARSYKTLAREAAMVPGFTFIWITDGCGWLSAQHNLEETFDVMEHLYNISDLESGVLSKVCR